MLKDAGELQALLLDLDGTLADSLGMAQSAYEKFLLTRSREPIRAEFESLNGPPLAEVIRRIKARHELPDSESELLASYSALLDDIYLEVSPNPGAKQLLARARSMGWKIGVVTSNSRARTSAWLERNGLQKAIDVIVASEDISVGKPNPEPYLLALSRSGCAAANCVAVEDSEQGACSARAAGVRTIVLGSKPLNTATRFEEYVPNLFAVALLLWPEE